MLSWFKSTGLRRPYAIIHLTTHHSWFNCKNMSLVQHLPKSAMTHRGRSSKGLRHGAHAWKWWEGGQSQSAYWITTLHYIISSYIMSCVMKRSRMVYRQLYIWQIIYICDYIICIIMYLHLSLFINIQQWSAIILSMPQLNPWSSQTSRNCLVSLPLIPKKTMGKSMKIMKIYENHWRSIRQTRYLVGRNDDVCDSWRSPFHEYCMWMHVVDTWLFQMNHFGMSMAPGGSCGWPKGTIMRKSSSPILKLLQRRS